jgi:hypothetical protein
MDGGEFYFNRSAAIIDTSSKVEGLLFGNPRSLIISFMLVSTGSVFEI